MRKIYLLLSLFLFTITIHAQKNGSVKGVAFDTISRQPVASATVSVLDKKDSSLVTFTMTDNTGKFELRGIPNGDYRLMITHVNYHNSNSGFTITDDKKNADLGNITLNDKNKVLDEVIVKNEDPPVTLIGDTIQYNAGSFKTAPNANVEQLLKRLPGVKVEKDGTIKAQGETVNRVLVDGKEFFGNDPKVATKNLPADAIDKVQVYDKQSDQAELTGFDDGNYEKTINLKLKKDKKKGLFGKITGGAGDKERYEGRFNVNSFKGARQISALGMANNTNAEGFSFTDIMNFSGALNQLMRGSGGNININISQSDAAALGMGGAGNGGINTAWAGGLNYNDIIGTKLDWQSNYFYNRYNPRMQSRTLRQNILGNTSNYYDEVANSDNMNNSHRFNVNALYQIDSFHSIRITPNISYQQTNNRSGTNYTTRAENQNLVNSGFSNNFSNSEGYNFRNDIVFRKKFHRKGRTFSLSVNTSLNASEGDGSLETIISYYNNLGNLSRRDTMDQQSINNSDLKGYNARAVYTEPVGRRSLLELSAGKSNTSSTSSKTTYDYNRNSAKYDRINQQQTNDFENTYGFTNGGIRFRTQYSKFNYSLGLTWQQAELQGKIISMAKDSIISKTFQNLLPNASFTYNFSRFKSLSINYSTNTNQPSMSQLQPVPDVSNPLYIREGNPDLKQEFSHAIRANLNLLSPYRNRNFFFFLNASATQNRIVNYDSVNLQTGTRKTKPVNVNGVYNMNGTISYSRPVHFLKGTMEISSNIGYNKGKQFVNVDGNTLINDIKTLSLGPELRFDINATDKLNFTASAGYNYNNAKYSVQSALNNIYLSQVYKATADWQLPKSFYLSSEFTYTVNSKRAAGFNLSVPIWNASISKQFLKFNRGEIKLAVSDILNRNTGISRNANQNYIEDKEVNTLKRFFLLTFTYSISKTGLNNAGGPGGARVIMR